MFTKEQAKIIVNELELIELIDIVQENVDNNPGDEYTKEYLDALNSFVSFAGE